MPRLSFLDPSFVLGPVERFFTPLHEANLESQSSYRPLVIGLNGEKESGKDTFYKFFSQYHDSVERDAFADRLKISSAHALGYRFDTLDEYLEWADWMKNEVVIRISEDKEITGREYLQFYGTEAHREVFDMDFWIDIVLDQERSSDILMVTDVRFPNEAKAIRDLGGQIWRINRDQKREADTHASEQWLSNDLVDVEIDNNARPRELEAVAREMAHALKV